MPPFELRGGEVGEPGVASVGIIPALDILKRSRTAIGLGAEPAKVQKFTQQAGKEALTQRVVTAISHRSHGGSHPSELTALPKGDRGVLAALIRVMNHPVRSTLPQGYLQGIQDQLSLQVDGHGPVYQEGNSGGRSSQSARKW